MRVIAALLAGWLALCGAGPATQAASGIVAPDAGAPACGDFLAEIGRKPAGAAFVGCAYFPERQGKPLRATYRLDGTRAGRVEARLVKSVGLARLKRSCCLWDAPARRFRDARGREFSIRMTSEETPVATRARWRRIATFEIVVEMFTEEI